jgi:hypothetical protein
VDLLTLMLGMNMETWECLTSGSRLLRKLRVSFWMTDLRIYLLTMSSRSEVRVSCWFLTHLVLSEKITTKPLKFFCSIFMKTS